MKLRLPYLLFFSFFLTGKGFAQYVGVDENLTPQQLVSDILIDNPCANASNVASDGLTQGSGGSIGHFTYAGTDFPFSEGVVLSTGKATSATGPNSGILSEGPTSWGGDADLETALGVGNSINATVLEFDFLPFASEISFDYIFSSEQYLSNPGSNQCNYTDGFVFLLKEAGSANPYVNLAVVPGTDIPVRVNSVRGPGTICPEANAAWFDAFNGSEHPTNYNGQTKVMKASATVTPGVLYHMKLVVADQGNNLYDSAIFLGAGSFKIGKNLGEDRLLATSNPVCFGASLPLDATEPGTNSYQWFKNDIAIPSATNAVYNVTDAGDYKVEISYGTSGCLGTGEITVEFANPLTPSSLSSVSCDASADGIASFNLSYLTTQILVASGTDNLVGFYEDPATTAPINTPDAYLSVPKTVYALSRNAYGCQIISTVQLSISTGSLPPLPPVARCDEDQDGKTAFDFDEIRAEITATAPAPMTINFYTTLEEAESETGGLAFPYINTTPFAQQLWARVGGTSDCFAILPVQLVVNVFDPAGFEPVSEFSCAGDPIRLEAPSGFVSYSWNTVPPQTSRTITVTVSGVYTVTATNADGCTRDKTFTVSASDVATIDSISVDDFEGGKNTVSIVASGPGNYEYSIDGGGYQPSPVFMNVPGGSYTAYVRDRNGCGMTTQPFYVFDYPKFFTPNGDSYNDHWRIPFFQFPTGARISVFDRYGKLLTTLSEANPSWDGSFGGTRCPADDYWFDITLPNDRNIRGHFALKR